MQSKMPDGKGKLTKVHGLVLRELLKGRTQREIAGDEKTGVTAIGMRFAKMKRFLNPKTLKRVEEARKARQDQLTDQDRRILASTLQGKSAAQVAREESLPSRLTVRSKLRKIRKLDPQATKRLYPKLTKVHGAIIRLRLQGKNYPEIASELGYNHSNTVRVKLMTALKFLHPKTLERLHIGERSPTNITRRQRIVEEFFKQIYKRSTRGAINATGRALGEDRKLVKHHLRMAGINSTGEIQRQRFGFLLKVAGTMHLPARIAQQQLGVKQNTLSRYRKRVEAGEHLHGPLELVESPEAQQWWDMKMPEVREEGAGSARINLAVRNETVEKDLKLIEHSRKAAREEARRHHPDIPGNASDAKARANFEASMKLMTRLKKASERYKAKEVEFREKYGLPVPEFLKNKR